MQSAQHTWVEESRLSLTWATAAPENVSATEAAAEVEDSYACLSKSGWFKMDFFLVLGFHFPYSDVRVKGAHLFLVRAASPDHPDVVASSTTTLVIPAEGTRCVERTYRHMLFFTVLHFVSCQCRAFIPPVRQYYTSFVSYRPGVGCCTGLVLDTKVANCQFGGAEEVAELANDVGTADPSLEVG